MIDAPLLKIRNITKKYRSGDTETEVLKGCSLEIGKGEVIAVIGRSGSGKTTLLNILGGLDCPDEGEVIWSGKALPRDYKSLTAYRKNNVGFVLQQYGLVSDLSVYQNIEIARRLVNSDIKTENMLERIGMSHKKKSMPFQLSGGEQQRTAIARALIKKPPLLLCDEPTGALDESTGTQIIGIIAELAQTSERTVVIVTHDSSLYRFADRVIRLENGILTEVVKKDMQDGE